MGDTQDLSYGRTCREPSPQTMGRISGQSLKRSAPLKTGAFLYLDLQGLSKEIRYVKKCPTKPKIKQLQQRFLYIIIRCIMERKGGSVL